MRNSHWNNVGQSLYLMDDGVDVRQILPVLYPDVTAPYHPAQLLLNLV